MSGLVQLTTKMVRTQNSLKSVNSGSETADGQNPRQATVGGLSTNISIGCHSSHMRGMDFVTISTTCWILRHLGYLGIGATPWIGHVGTNVSKELRRPCIRLDESFPHVGRLHAPSCVCFLLRGKNKNTPIILCWTSKHITPSSSCA